MKAIELLTAVMTNSNDLEQMGEFSICRGMGFYFGQSTEVLCGEVETGHDYVYIYNEPLRGDNGILKCDIVLRNDVQTIFLYKVEE